MKKSKVQIGLMVNTPGGVGKVVKMHKTNVTVDLGKNIKIIAVYSYNELYDIVLL